MTTKWLLSAAFLWQALASYFVLTQQYPTSGDDYSFMYQARLFAAGKLYAQDPLYDLASTLHSCVATNCIKDFHGHRFSQYPPGWPLLLAVGVALGVPWIIGPLLGALLVLLMLIYAERSMGKELVPVTWLLLTLCIFFVYYAATYRAHIAAALFVFAAFLSYDAAERQPSRARIWLFIAGALLGYSSMIRYIDWLPLAAWIGVSLLRRKEFAGVALFVAGFTLLASGNLLYDTLLFGDPFQSPSTINRNVAMNGPLVVSWIGFEMTGRRLASLLGIFPPTLLLALFFKRYHASLKVRMYLTLFLTNVGIYYFYVTAVGGPGPRYLLVYFPFLVLAVVDLYRWIHQEGTRCVRYLWKVGILALVIGNLVFTAVVGYTMYGRRDLERAEQRIGPGRKIVLLKSGTYLTNSRDLTRNPPDLSTAENLYFDWCPQPARDNILKRFPDRRIFVYEYPGRLYPYVPGS